MNRWHQVLLQEKAREPVREETTRTAECQVETVVGTEPAGVLELAREHGYPRVWLQPGVYLCAGREMWLRFVRTASPEWLEKAAAGLTMLKNAEDSGRTRP